MPKVLLLCCIKPIRVPFLRGCRCEAGGGGLAAARSTRGSDSPPDCHPTPRVPLRYPPLRNDKDVVRIFADRPEAGPYVWIVRNKEVVRDVTTPPSCLSASHLPLHRGGKAGDQWSLLQYNKDIVQVFAESLLT